MSQPFRTPHRVAQGGLGVETLRARSAGEFTADCGAEPGGLTYRRAREILFAHEVHGPQCRQWLAAAAYLSAGLDDE
ncbi:hypothetical protein IU433_01455 [Nocardia puris]|uniref:Uncharacterized protein n=1 Tax=Nocardia puris TaxID=208602 RepID=A0A366DUY3_9NOCA|nr:hypothetical protein [Nocardia puris]MBF6210452.1 hypothetical protein [Nocardia puris]MBF6367527.1 hypothetical protein [Nocardia puris]MBF6457712.1 hypothetical protein [Nocardia puris]RBO93877.1 hypothetical protein DFR74_102297 [Nocardia puris]